MKFSLSKVRHIELDYSMVTLSKVCSLLSQSV